MDKRFLAILAAIVIILGGIFVVSSRNNGGTSSNAQPTNHVEGKDKANVTLVEYGDFECPICAEFYASVKQAEAKLDGQIKFQFRELPLSSIHKNAMAAARAAEAASNQGKFWQMHDLLYQNQDPTGSSGWVASNDPLNQYFVGYANQLGLDINKFKTDYASSQTNNVINADINAFLSTSFANHNVAKEATPSFFVDGNYVDNSNFIDSSNRPSAAKIEDYLQSIINSKH